MTMLQMNLGMTAFLLAMVPIWVFLNWKVEQADRRLRLARAEEEVLATLGDPIV